MLQSFYFLCSFSRSYWLPVTSLYMQFFPLSQEGSLLAVPILVYPVSKRLPCTRAQYALHNEC